MKVSAEPIYTKDNPLTPLQTNSWTWPRWTWRSWRWRTWRRSWRSGMRPAKAALRSPTSSERSPSWCPNTRLQPLRHGLTCSRRDAQLWTSFGGRGGARVLSHMSVSVFLEIIWHTDSELWWKGTESFGRAALNSNWTHHLVEFHLQYQCTDVLATKKANGNVINVIECEIRLID